MSRHDDETAARLSAYFAARLDEYGHDPRGVDWQSRDAQQARFAALVGLCPFDGASILDASCGFGDLYGYLTGRGLTVCYTGCDLSWLHIRAARAAYPAVRFIHGDVRAVVATERFDYVVACGMLHLRVPRWNRWAWDCVRAMYGGCRQGLAFTLPRRGAGHPPVLAVVDPADWLPRLRTLAPQARVVALDPWGDAAYFLPRSG